MDKTISNTILLYQYKIKAKLLEATRDTILQQFEAIKDLETKEAMTEKMNLTNQLKYITKEMQNLLAEVNKLNEGER